ncbi:MAG: hypothetical protein Q9P44_21045 [Anaerolineae bacterium]|nr:hypothetical protein [Anaerolineae bacterium]
MGVWFNYWRFIAVQRGLAVPERMQEVADEDEQWAKEEVAKRANSSFRNMPLRIQHQAGRAIAYTAQGNLFGYIAKDNTHDVSETITIHFCIAKDGNLLTVFH